MTPGAHDVIATRAVTSRESPKPVSSVFDMKGALSWYEAMFVEYILPPAYAHLHREVATEVAAQAPRGRILDVGCGSGGAAIHLATLAPQALVVGVDLSRRMLRYGERRLQQRGATSVSLRYGDATELPFEDEQFDMAYSIASLKMWPDRDAGLREMHRVLRPGGRIIVLELDRGATDEAVRNYARRFRLIPAGICAIYVRAYVVAQSPDILDAQALMQRSPFAHFDVTRMPDYPFFAIRAQKA